LHILITFLQVADVSNDMILKPPKLNECTSNRKIAVKEYPDKY
jgi:hypothetical protein